MQLREVAAYGRTQAIESRVGDAGCRDEDFRHLGRRTVAFRVEEQTTGEVVP